MKIINEKGKLFGIINIVDLFVLVAVIAVVGAILWQLAGDRVCDSVSPQKELTAVVVVAGAHPDLVAEVERQELIGAQMVSGNSYINGYIDDIWLDNYEEQNPSADGTLVSSIDPVKKDIFFQISTTVAADTASPKIGSQEIRAGKTFIIKTQTFECSGVIYYVDIAD